MYRRTGWLALIAALMLLAFGASSARADWGALCWSDPTSGPPGTKFGIYCTGFSPNTHVNAYVVEPDGRAISAGQVVGFVSNVDGGDILTDKDGNASFWWVSAGGEAQPGGGSFAHQIGDWTWVVHQLGLTQSVVAQGQTTVTIESQSWDKSGAWLSYSSDDKANFSFWGSGFRRDEYVNIWVSMPANCSGRSNVEGASADDPYYQGLFDGFFGPNTVKANEYGEISFPISFSERACRGWYAASVYAPGSGYGAKVEFEVGGNAIIETLGQSISVTPSSVDALYPWVTILGSGWDSWAPVSCWSTRPDGRSFSLGTTKADASGYFAWDVAISGNDSFAPYASEEPGLWSMTCNDPTTGQTALTTVLVHALTSDP